MFTTTLKRVIRSGFVDFWRNRVVSLASVFVMIVTLFTVGSVVFLEALLTTTLSELSEKVDINVYFTAEARESDILAAKVALEGLPEVASVEYISREQALENFRTRHASDHLTLQALEELDDNPLGAVFNVRAKETSQYGSIASFFETSDALSSGGASIVDKVNYYQNKVVIERLSTIIESSERIGFAAALVLIALSVLIAFNTTRLAIYTAREEIGVMRLVGASNSYIRGPFVVSGVLAGAVAGAFVLGAFLPLSYWATPPLKVFFAGFDLFHYYLAHFPSFLLIIGGTGVLLGAAASALAVKKYLKV
jgi:cell division transport system permease protein